MVVVLISQTCQTQRGSKQSQVAMVIIPSPLYDNAVRYRFQGWKIWKKISQTDMLQRYNCSAGRNTVWPPCPCLEWCPIGWQLTPSSHSNWPGMRKLLNFSLKLFFHSSHHHICHFLYVQRHEILWGYQRLSKSLCRYSHLYNLSCSSRANWFILSIFRPLTQTIWLFLQVYLKEYVDPNILSPHIILFHCCIKSKPTWQHPGKS